MKDTTINDTTTRRRIIKQSLMVVPTIMSFTLADLKVHASQRPSPGSPSTD